MRRASRTWLVLGLLLLAGAVWSYSLDLECLLASQPCCECNEADGGGPDRCSEPFTLSSLAMPALPPDTCVLAPPPERLSPIRRPGEAPLPPHPWHGPAHAGRAPPVA
ncbi:MAG: hypothetical protein AB1758_22560 [Candidatus Eremiobacterota bacterium]